MELTTKYSSKIYEVLCFRHAVQEAMRGENIDVTVIDANHLQHMFSSCFLCDAENKKSEKSLLDWYHNFRFDK